MALSGAVNTTAYKGRYLQLTWSATQNVEENTSSVSWTLKGAGTSSEEYYDAGPFTVTIDGKTVYESSERIRLYNGTQVAGGTEILHHQQDGTKTFVVSLAAGICADEVNCAGSATCVLTPILMTEKPVITELSITETNPSVMELTGNAGFLVRFYSIVAVRVKAAAQNGVGIASITASCADGKKLQADADTLQGTLYGIESGKFTVTVVDNRGNCTQQQVNLPMIPYVKLTCAMESTKPDPEGRMPIRISGNFYQGFLGVEDNAFTLMGYRYKVQGGEYGDWISMTPTIQDDNTYTAAVEVTGLNYQNAYVVQVRVQDKLLNKMVRVIQTSEYTAKAIPVFDWSGEDFNVNGTFRINEQPVADFVVEQGEYAPWHYRKWNSGLAECWAEAEVFVNISGGAGSLFCSELCPGVLYPTAVTFLDTPGCFAQLRANAYNAWLVAATEGTAAKTPGYRILAPSQYTGGQHTVQFRVIGRWK